MNLQTLVLIGLIILAIAGLVFIPRLLIKRALSRVIGIFKRYGALSPSSAKSIDELGLRPRSFFEGMFRTRDYKPYALDMLRRSNIVRTTEDERLYLSEETLVSSGLEKRVGKISLKI